MVADGPEQPSPKTRFELDQVVGMGTSVAVGCGVTAGAADGSGTTGLGSWTARSGDATAGTPFDDGGRGAVLPVGPGLPQAARRRTRIGIEAGRMRVEIVVGIWVASPRGAVDVIAHLTRRREVTVVVAKVSVSRQAACSATPSRSPPPDRRSRRCGCGPAGGGRVTDRRPTVRRSPRRPCADTQARHRDTTAMSRREALSRPASGRTAGA